MKTQMFKLFATWAVIGLCGTASAAPKVVTDIPPVHALTAKVMAGIGAPELLIPGNASPHGHHLRPSEARALAGADVLIWISPTLTPWLERARQKINPSAQSIVLLDAPGIVRHETRSMEDFAAASHEAEDHQKKDHHGHGHHDHGHDENSLIDPHAWLDPDNAAHWLDTIAKALAVADPANQAAYAANAEAGKAELAGLTLAMQQQLKDAREQPFIVLHDGFQYFERRFGLTTAGAIRAGDGTAPGPKRIHTLRQRIAESGAKCLFREPQFPDRLAATLAADGISIAVLDPLGKGLEPGWPLYPALIQNLASAIATCQAQD